MHNIEVELVYALKEKQWLKSFVVARGISAVELVEQSGLFEDFPNLKSEDELQLGIYGEKVKHDHLLEQGDRVEIYRSLKADPKEVRRLLALQGKTMGKK